VKKYLVKIGVACTRILVKPKVSYEENTQEVSQEWLKVQTILKEIVRCGNEAKKYSYCTSEHQSA